MKHLSRIEWHQLVDDLEEASVILAKAQERHNMLRDKVNGVIYELTKDATT